MSFFVRTQRSLQTTLLTILLLFVTVSLLADDATEKPNPYLLWTGPAYSWPDQPMETPKLSSKWYIPPAEEENATPRMNYFIECGNMNVCVDNMNPFHKDTQSLPQSILPGALILRDARMMDGTMCFTRVSEGNFIPGPDRDSIMGYAKALTLSSVPGKGLTVEVMKGPSEIGRKELMLLRKPLFLTWSLKQAATKRDFVRTDFFFDLNDGSILVVSAISGPNTHDILVSDVKEFMRRATLVPKE